MHDATPRPDAATTITFDDGLTVEQRAAAWHAQGERQRDAMRSVGTLRGAGLGARPGLELMRSQLDGTTPLAPFGELMRMYLVDADAGRVTLQCTPDDRYLSLLGTVHGGVYASLLDSAVGCAVHTTLAAEETYATLELSVRFVRPIRLDTGPIRAVGRVEHRSRQVAIATGRMFDAAGKLYAHASTTCLVLPATAPARTERAAG